MIELLIAMFIINIVILGVIKTFSYGVSQVQASTQNTQALALAEEALEKIRYLRDTNVRNNQVEGWQKFLNGLAVIPESSGSGLRGAGSQESCDENGKLLRFIRGIDEQSELFKNFPESNGRLAVIENEEDREEIIVQQSDAEPLHFYRKIMCKTLGTNPKLNRVAADDVLEFTVQIDWEYKSIERALPLQMVLAK